jgi:hypothetical protein
VCTDEGFGDQEFSTLHPHLRTTGYQNPRSALARRYEGLGVELLGLLLTLGPINLFDLFLVTMRAQRGMITRTVFTICYI